MHELGIESTPLVANGTSSGFFLADGVVLLCCNVEGPVGLSDRVSSVECSALHWGRETFSANILNLNRGL